MVGGERSEARRERRPATVGQLVRMQLDRQAQFAGALEERGDLDGAEGDLLALGVDGVRETAARHLRQQHVRDETQILHGPPPEFRRDGVRRE